MLSAVLELSWLIILIGTTVVSAALPTFTRKPVAIKLFFSLLSIEQGFLSLFSCYNMIDGELTFIFPVINQYFGV
jgi:hypothetical protein